MDGLLTPFQPVDDRTGFVALQLVGGILAIVVKNLAPLACIEGHHVEVGITCPDAEPADAHGLLFTVLGLDGFQLLLGSQADKREHLACVGS